MSILAKEVVEGMRHRSELIKRNSLLVRDNRYLIVHGVRLYDEMDELYDLPNPPEVPPASPFDVQAHIEYMTRVARDNLASNSGARSSTDRPVTLVPRRYAQR